MTPEQIEDLLTSCENLFSDVDMTMNDIVLMLDEAKEQMDGIQATLNKLLEKPNGN